MSRVCLLKGRVPAPSDAKTTPGTEDIRIRPAGSGPLLLLVTEQGCHQSELHDQVPAVANVAGGSTSSSARVVRLRSAVGGRPAPTAPSRPPVRPSGGAQSSDDDQCGPASTVTEGKGSYRVLRKRLRAQRRRPSLEKR